MTRDKIHGVTPAQTGWRYVVLIDDESYIEDPVAVWFSMGDEAGISYVLPGTVSEGGAVWPTEPEDYSDGACVGLFSPTATPDQIKDAVAERLKVLGRLKGI